MQNIGLILLVVSLSFLVLLLPKVYKSIGWRATITPLASIIGSGFLVLGPILASSFGAWAVFAMAALCGVAYLFGHAIRFNITRLYQTNHRSDAERFLEKLASWALAFAYIISVSYYLNLFGAFGVSLTAFDTPFAAKSLTSAVFVVILVVGWTKGFTALERMEQVSVSIKLAIIVGLLVGLILILARNVSTNTLVFTPSTLSGWPALTLLFGLLVTVQGFETSRYLTDEYSANMRVRSMRWSQWLSTLIYLAYIAMVSLVFTPSEIITTETGIIDMMAKISPVLPILLVAAALSAQFSASVADTGGAGGLFAEVTDNRIPPKFAYALLTAIGLIFTWVADVFLIIRYASQAFALYYTLQACIAAIGVFHQKKSWLNTVLYLGLAILGMFILVFGTSFEAELH
ncbi:MAG: hypothetical protein COA47_08025 [Robiginitomaculum sp.]|nr:MAG: hypothetical protein COA47_08025 [Robiginitomaculum sp.]